MKKLLKGESGARDVKVDTTKKTATVTHCWKKDRDAARYQLCFKYNFDVELTEVYRLAALWVNKDFQNRMRAEGTSEKELKALEQREISVTEMYTKRERASRDPKKAAESALNKLSPAEVKELLAVYKR